MGKAAYLLEKSRYSSNRATPTPFEFAQLCPRFLHNANYNLCATPPFARVCVHHSFIPFKPSRGLPLQRDPLTACVHFFLEAEYRSILHLPPTFRYPIFRPICLLLSLVSLSFFLFFSFRQEQRRIFRSFDFYLFFLRPTFPDIIHALLSPSRVFEKIVRTV